MSNPSTHELGTFSDIDHTDQVNSLERLLEVALQQTGSGARVCAKLLASCYNGQRFQLDLTDLRLLDDELFEHAINVLRLDHAPAQEVHCYFDNGSAIWEQMIKDWGFEKT